MPCPPELLWSVFMAISLRLIGWPHGSRSVDNVLIYFSL